VSENQDLDIFYLTIATFYPITVFCPKISPGLSRSKSSLGNLPSGSDSIKLERRKSYPVSPTSPKTESEEGGPIDCDTGKKEHSEFSDTTDHLNSKSPLEVCTPSLEVFLTI